MWKFILVGAAAAAVMITFCIGYSITGPGTDSPGEATTNILGHVVDRVPIPPNPADGAAEWPRGRIQGGLIATYAAAVTVACVVGSLLGWCVWRTRQNRAEPNAATDPAGM